MFVYIDGAGVASRRTTVYYTTTDSVLPAQVGHVTVTRHGPIITSYDVILPVYRNLSQLVEGLGNVLNDPNKAVLFHYICQLLPGKKQAEFDKLAATTIAEGPPAVVRSSHTLEGMGDTLYRVQGERLSSEGK